MKKSHKSTLTASHYLVRVVRNIHTGTYINKHTMCIHADYVVLRLTNKACMCGVKYYITFNTCTLSSPWDKFSITWCLFPEFLISAPDACEHNTSWQAISSYYVSAHENCQINLKHTITTSTSHTYTLYNTTVYKHNTHLTHKGRFTTQSKRGHVSRCKNWSILT